MQTCTYLDVSKSDTRTCTTGTIHRGCVSLSVGYGPGDGEYSSIIICWISQCAYLLVWMGESNWRLDKICLVGTKLKNVAFPRFLQKGVQASGNIARWL